MQQNVAGQNIAAQMITAADGSPFTGTVSVFVNIDDGGQVAGAGVITHEGNGAHNYAPTQAETNGSHIAFTFTNALAINATIQVYTDFPQSGDSFTRLGAPAGASVSSDIAVIDANTDAILVDTGTDIPNSLATIDTNVDAILVDTGTTLPAGQAAISVQIAGLNDFNPATDTVANVTLVATTTNNTDMRGTDGANTIAPDNAGITANGVAIASLNDISVNDILTTQMVESYAADGVAPTMTQALFNIQQNLGDFIYAGTTQTVRQIDGSTTAMTYTLDDAVNPTSKTRTT